MIGETLSHYRIVGQLGAGGMGVVYHARDEQLSRDVAIKVLPPDVLTDSAARTRFRREALSLSQVNHPSICTIYDIGELKGSTYIVMEYLDGRPLSKLIPPGGLAIETAQRYALQIADALAYVHKHGMLHRDVKSSNVIVTREGRVKLLDFRLAKRMEPAETDATLTSETLTQRGAVVGTLAYMAPEVLSGQDADQRSDVWALGVLLHEMVAGARPFQGSSEFTLTSAILREPAPPLPNYTPAGLRNVITRCLAKDPAQRYESAIEVAAALEAVSAA